MQAIVTFEILLLGLLVGYISGLFGKGGSAIATPLLQLIGVPAFFAIASPLPAAIPGTLVASLAYLRQGLYEKRIVLWGIAFGFPATIVGSLLSPYFGGRNLLIVSDLLLVGLGASYLAPERLRRIVSSKFPSRPMGTKAFTCLNVVIAIVVGFVSGVLANSGGFLLAPLYNKVLRLPLKSAFSCSLLVAAALAIPGTVTHLFLGHIDWKIVFVFGLGSVPLSYLGARTAIQMPVTKLEPLFGIVLTTIGLWGALELI